MVAYQRRSMFPFALENVVALVGELSDDAYSGLLAELRSPDGFETDDRRVGRLAERIGADLEDSKALVAAVAYMYGKVHRGNEPEIGVSELREILARDIPMDEGGDTSRLLSRLVEMLTRNAAIEDYRQIAKLKAGLLPKAVAFSTAVDLRPALSADGQSLDRLVPLMQFRIVSDAGDERTRTSLFQLDARSLDALEATVKELRERLAVLKASPALSPLILD